MHVVEFIQDLAVIMLVAGFTTVLFHRFKQPVVLGYLLAGVIIGPYTPPFSLIHDQESLRTLGELGVVFLLFSLGLEFNLRQLKKVGLAAIAASSLELIFMIAAGYGLGRLFGWSTFDSIFLGAILSISSTTIIVKALKELNYSNEPFVKLVFGILIVEDILAIAMLALLSTISVSGTIALHEVLITLAKLILFIVVSLSAGLLIIPRILSYVGKFKRDEVLLVTVLGLCFGFCLLVLKMKYSIGLGAFIIGAIMAESDELNRIEKLITPIRDMFSAIFFVSVGSLFNPHVLVNFYVPIILISLLVVTGKILSCSIGTFAVGQDMKNSLRTGMSLAQIGEFSFIIASLGVTLGVTSSFLYPIAVAVSIVTTFFTPYLIRLSLPLSEKL